MIKQYDGKKYKSVKLTKEEMDGLTGYEITHISCKKCVAINNVDLCGFLSPCFNDIYYIETIKKIKP